MIIDSMLFRICKKEKQSLSQKISQWKCESSLAKIMYILFKQDQKFFLLGIIMIIILKGMQKVNASVLLSPENIQRTRFCNLYLSNLQSYLKVSNTYLNVTFILKYR